MSRRVVGLVVVLAFVGGAVSVRVGAGTDDRAFAKCRRLRAV